MLTAGALSQVSVGSTTDSLLSGPATGGTGPYTYQWYRSVVSGFSVGSGNLIAGATSLTLSDSGLIPNTQYYYKVVSTDTGNSNVTVTSAQLAVATTAPVLNPNQFAQTEYLGVVDQAYNYNTKSVQIDVSQPSPVYAGAAVKMVNSVGGIPKVIACTADGDTCIGFVNFNFKNVTYPALTNAEISQGGNVIYLYATGVISRGAQVTLDITTNGGVSQLVGSSGASIVGWALDASAAAGTLIRVQLTCPTFAVA